MRFLIILLFTALPFIAPAQNDSGKVVLGIKQEIPDWWITVRATQGEKEMVIAGTDICPLFLTVDGRIGSYCPNEQEIVYSGHYTRKKKKLILNWTEGTKKWKIIDWNEQEVILYRKDVNTYYYLEFREN